MNKRILLGVDANLSPTTQQALRSIGDILEFVAPQARVVLLNVIPVPQLVTTHPGMYGGQVLPNLVADSQRQQAEEALRKARLTLQRQGIPLDRTEAIIRSGAIADEIVKAARELRVSFIVIGSHDTSLKQRLRRFLIGSISGRVLQLASCPVMINKLQQPRRIDELIQWYEDAIKHYLQDNTDALTVFTPEQVVQRFTLTSKSRSERKEMNAARQALEQLADSGLLCRHQIKGELRYVND
jgi:nucleotide-binding universal stress UspA family protein